MRHVPRASADAKRSRLAMGGLCQTCAVIMCLLGGCARGGRGMEMKAESSEPPRIIISNERHFAISDGSGVRPFTPWGVNYDRTAIDGRDVLLEDVLAQRPEKVDADFAAIRRRGANTVRVFIATSLILRGPSEIDPEGIAHVRRLLESAHKNELCVILTGLANIRPSTAPQWIQDADDEMMLRAGRLFWQSLADACRDAPAVFAYDLQNEPAIHWRNSRSWTDGCFDMPTGPPFCYVHRHYRQIEQRWTRHVRERFASPAQLEAHWPDFPRAGETWDAIAVPEPDPSDPRYEEYVAFHSMLLRDWARGLRDVIRSRDPHHLITVGALDPVPMADAVDFYCLHLYPQPAASADEYFAANRAQWQRQIERLPRDDRPLLIEEMFPLALAPGVDLWSYLRHFLDVTRSRAAGWVSFYWGEPDSLPMHDAAARNVYAAWLEVWSRQAPARDR